MNKNMEDIIQAGSLLDNTTLFTPRENVIVELKEGLDVCFVNYVEEGEMADTGESFTNQRREGYQQAIKDLEQMAKELHLL